MTVDFGLALIERHPKSHLTKWMDDLEAVLPKLEGHFKSVWMTDHLFWSDLYAYECWTVLTWLAAKWPTFDVGPMVMGQNYRNPGLVAKMAATLQVFSGGRCIVGLGAGWKEDEYRAFGYNFPTPGARVEQLAETLEILKRLWTQPGKVTYNGKHYQVVDAYLEPKPVPVPKIVVGTGGDRALGVVARHADWWNLSDANIRRYRDRLGVLKQRCDSTGRDPASIRLTWFGRIVVGRTQDEISARAASRDTRYSTENAFVGTPAQVVEQMQEFTALGVSYFMVDILDVDRPDVQAMVLEELLPKVK